MKRKIKAWVFKYILKIKSPSTSIMGYDFEWDYLTQEKHK